MQVETHRIINGNIKHGSTVYMSMNDTISDAKTVATELMDTDNLKWQADPDGVLYAVNESMLVRIIENMTSTIFFKSTHHNLMELHNESRRR